MADPPPHLPSHKSRQHPCSWLQGGGNDDDPVRHGRAQPDRPLRTRVRRNRPIAQTQSFRRSRPAGDARQADRAPGAHPPLRRGPRRGEGLDLAALSGGESDVNALAFNAGSSTLKACLYKLAPGVALATPPTPIWRRQLNWRPGTVDDGAAARLLREVWEGPEAPLAGP